MEVLHMRRKNMKEYKMAGLHHAEFYRDARMVEWGVYRWMMRRAGGQEDRATWSRRIRKIVEQVGGAFGGSGRGNQDAGGERGRSTREWCWTEGRGTRPDRAYCCVRRWDSKSRGGRCRVRPGSGMMSMRICSGQTTSREGHDRGTSAGGAPRRQGKSRGQSCE